MQQQLARISSGAVSGIAATAAMSWVMVGARRWGLLGEYPPRRLIRKLLSRLATLSPRGRSLDVAATLAHFGFGAAMGALFWLIPGRRGVARGALFGLGVWATHYAGILPELGLMPPARRDRPGRPFAMIVAHLVYGATLGLSQPRLAPILERKAR
jgi:hypothetical protein